MTVDPIAEARVRTNLGIKRVGPRPSNKGCPRWYRALRDPNPDAEASPPKRCGCPKGRCWYDEQKARYEAGERIVIPEDWPERGGAL